MDVRTGAVFQDVHGNDPVFSPDGRLLVAQPRNPHEPAPVRAHAPEDLEPLPTGWAEPVVTRSPDS
ncbi:hypothetical protein [Saccharothrix syringae]|uniref:hypothetical protein n=1 Tax=Saccharothrix syringae TaxID=103733 RepID=UPI001476BA3E|nr:hypothetical protein [Saccharothrix syringae]